MALEVIFVPVITFFLLNIISATESKGITKISGSIRRNETFYSYPRVYNATILRKANPLKFFASEVDLIQFDRNDNEESFEISFLVHDNEELIHVKAMATLPSMNVVKKSIALDVKTTLDLHQQINYIGPKKKVASKYSTISDFSCYKDLQGSLDWMDAMVKRSESIAGLSVTKTDIGDSWLKTQDLSQGYDIWVLKVTGIPSSSSSNSRKAIFFIMTGLHAREFAPTELASRWVESMISGYGQNADITAILDVTEIHLVLQSNPDGRHIVETDRTTVRRKNMNSGSKNCRPYNQGVDLNRNFQFRWGLDSGSSPQACSWIFRGTEPASEPEVRAIQKYTESIFPVEQRKERPYAQEKVPYSESKTMGVFLDIHSFGGMILTPWGYSNNTVGNARGFQTIADKVQFFTAYKTSIGYFSSGCSMDFAYGHLGVASMTFELGNKFFQDCETFETSILPQNLPTLTYLAKIARAPFRISKGPDITILSTVVKGNFLTVNVTASDSALSYSGVSTSKQSIRRIRVFLNIHPYSISSNNSTKGYVLKSGRGVIDVSNLSNQSRHVVYAEATDSAGYTGPITAAYFFK